MTVGDALRAGDMLADKGISARVFSMHTIKPVDKDAILQSAKRN